MAQECIGLAIFVAKIILMILISSLYKVLETLACKNDNVKAAEGYASFVLIITVICATVFCILILCMAKNVLIIICCIFIDIINIGVLSFYMNRHIYNLYCVKLKYDVSTMLWFALAYYVAKVYIHICQICFVLHEGNRSTYPEERWVYNYGVSDGNSHNYGNSHNDENSYNEGKSHNEGNSHTDGMSHTDENSSDIIV